MYGIQFSMNLNEILDRLRQERDRINRAIEALSSVFSRKGAKKAGFGRLKQTHLTVVMEPKRIKKFHAQLYRELNVHCSFVQARPEFRADSEHRAKWANWKPRVLSDSDYNYWFYFDQFSNDPIRKGHNWGRFWCLYGLGKPATGDHLKNSVQVNFHYKGSSRVAGAFAQDDAKRTFVVHSGRAGGGEKGITQKKLLDCMRRSSTVDRVIWGSRECEVMVIAELGTPQIRGQFAQFVKSIDSCKEHIRSRGNR
jgi:hypothetical protein